MEFKIKIINSKQLSEIDTRRVIVNVESFSFYDYSCYLKSLFNLNDNDDIYIKFEKKNTWIITEKEWKDFIGSIDPKEDLLIKLTVYCGNVHLNITCDNCNDTVVGDRFKCLQCDDYDICQICFQANPIIHNEHCLILLRKPEDSEKFLRSIPFANQNGSDFRVLDINLDCLINGTKIEKTVASTQTEEISKPGGDNIPFTKEKMEISVNMNDKVESSIQTDGAKNNSFTNEDKEKTCTNDSNKNTNDCFYSSVSKSYFDSLPKEIHEGLEKLKGMGYANMDGTLIALLVANNGNVSQVVEELEYSSKH